MNLNSVVFLDLDGTLNSWNVSSERLITTSMAGYHPSCLEALQWFLETTGAKIVMSTMHRRHHPDPADWEADLISVGVTAAQVVGCTPILPHYPRGAEIDAWLREHGDFPFVILDDASDMEPHRSRLIRTQMHIGLTMPLARRAVELFGDGLEKT